MAAKRVRVPCGVGAGFWAARCSASKFDDAASARGRDLMMRTAGERIMSINGARRAQTSPGMRAFGGPRWEGLYCPVHELALPAPGAALKSGSARSPSACVLFVLSLAQSSPVAKCEAKSHDALSRRPASSDPRFSIGPRGTSPGGFSERAGVSQPFPRLWRVSGPPWTTPRRPAGEHHEHSGARGEEFPVF